MKVVLKYQKKKEKRKKKTKAFTGTKTEKMNTD
jgi:hypothetical protein